MACWPVNALFYTTHRYVVSAELTSPQAVAQPAVAPTLASNTSWKPTLPAGLTGSSLSLAKVSMPMGSMHFASSVPPAWIQSPEPLHLEENAIVELNAGIAALEAKRNDW